MVIIHVLRDSPIHPWILTVSREPRERENYPLKSLHATVLVPTIGSAAMPLKRVWQNDDDDDDNNHGGMSKKYDCGPKLILCAAESK